MEILLPVTLVLLAGHGLLTSYSYWSDELWSVAASSGSWNDLLFRWLLPDTHPPLYQSLLKIWITLFGSSEPVTRGLSFLLAALALLATTLFAGGRGAGRRIIAVCIVGTSPLFLFYSQETRSSSLSLMLSSLMLGSLLRLRQSAIGADRLPLSASRTALLRWCFYGSTLLLGLTHYFSLLFAMVVLAAAAAEGLALAHRRSALLLLVAMLLWPAIHLLYLLKHQEVQRTLHRIDWIDVEPVFGTISQLVKSFLPIPSPFPDAALGGLVTASITVVLVACFTRPTRARLLRWWQTPAQILPWNVGELRFLLRVLGLFLGLVLLIDIIRPISISRYHIVVLPLLAFLGGDLWSLSRHQPRWQRALLTAVLCLFLAIQVGAGNQYLRSKQFPLVDYKGVAAYLRATDLCREGCWSLGWPRAALQGSYFRGLDLRDLPAAAVPSAIPLRLPLLVVHDGVKDLPLLRARHPGLHCWEAPGSLFGSFVLLPAGQQDHNPSRFALRRCSPLPP